MYELIKDMKEVVFNASDDDQEHILLSTHNQ